MTLACRLGRHVWILDMRIPAYRCTRCHTIRRESKSL